MGKNFEHTFIKEDIKKLNKQMQKMLTIISY